MLKKALNIVGEKSILARVKEKIPGPSEYLDDAVVLLLIVGYGIGKYQGVPIFPEDWVALAIMYVIGKELNS